MNTLEDLLEAISPNGPSRDILNPGDGELVGKEPVHSVQDLEVAIETAVKTQPAWAARGHA